MILWMLWQQFYQSWEILQNFLRIPASICIISSLNLYTATYTAEKFFLVFYPAFWQLQFVRE